MEMSGLQMARGFGAGVPEDWGEALAMCPPQHPPQTSIYP